MESKEQGELPPITNPTFILLLGPSGVGKSEILRHLVEQDSRIIPSIVVTDRSPRVDDFGKESVSSDELDQMESQGKFLTLEKAHGNRYGILKSSVNDALENGKIPIQDYPEDAVKNIKEKMEKIHTIYIVPPTLGELHRRSNVDSRDNDDKRYKLEREEILRLVKLHFKTDNIDDVVINRDIKASTQRVLDLIYKKVTR